MSKKWIVSLVVEDLDGDMEPDEVLGFVASYAQDLSEAGLEIEPFRIEVLSVGTN